MLKVYRLMLLLVIDLEEKMKEKKSFLKNSFYEVTITLYFLFILVCSPTLIFASEFQGTLNSVSITDANSSNQPPTASFNYVKNDNIYTFDASDSSDSDGTIVKYKWKFSDGTTSSGISTNYQEPEGSNEPIIVTLTVVDDNSSISLTQQTVLPQLIIDNTDVGFLTTGKWFSMKSPAGFHGENYMASAVDGNTTAEWNTTLSKNQEYGIYLKWQSHPNRSPKVPYEIVNNGVKIDSGYINQKNGESSFQLLGKFLLHPGSFKVKIFKDPGFTVTADALMIKNSQ